MRLPIAPRPTTATLALMSRRSGEHPGPVDTWYGTNVRARGLLWSDAQALRQTIRRSPVVPHPSASHDGRSNGRYGSRSPQADFGGVHRGGPGVERDRNGGLYILKEKGPGSQ